MVTIWNTKTDKFETDNKPKNKKDFEEFIKQFPNQPIELRGDLIILENDLTEIEKTDISNKIINKV